MSERQTIIERLHAEPGKTHRDISQDERAELFVEAAQRVEALESVIRLEKRVCEMSANIMRDAKRTGGWEGAERTANAFDRIARALDAALKDGE